MRPQEFTDRQENDREERGTPSHSSMRAAISLLADHDATVREMCRAQILAWGDNARELLEQAAVSNQLALRKNANVMLRTLDLEEWRRRVASFAAKAPRVGRMSWQQLEQGAMLLSSLGRRRDSVDARGAAETLQGFADDLAPRFLGKSAMTCARLMTGYLSNQLGYGGSQSSFYDVSNAQLDDVVAFRKGVPVALALVYILVGRRAGLDVTGVAIPDHFLVRVHGGRPVLLDPFHEGRQVTKADCVRYLRIAGYSLHTTSYLEDVHDCQILDSLLRNLLRVYGYREDNELCSVLENARRALVRT